MRTMIVTMLLPLAALVCAEVFTRTGRVSAGLVAQDRGGPAAAAAATCRLDGAGRLRLVAADGDRVLAQPHQLATAANGGVTAYAALLPDGLDLFVCSEAGNVLHRARLPRADVAAATSVGGVRLLSSTAAFVELHVDPSTSLGFLIDLRSGEHRRFEGHDFAPSHDARDVAYFREPPHGAAGGAAGVYVNDRKLADLPRASGVGLRWQGGRTLTATVRSWNGSEEAYELKAF